MRTDIYKLNGHHWGFIEDDNLYNSDSTHVGFLKGNDVYSIEGRFVGVLHKEKYIVKQPMGSIRNIQPIQPIEPKKVKSVLNVRETQISDGHIDALDDFN